MSIESGANDGLGIVLVGLAIAAVLPDKTAPDAVVSLAREVIVAVVGGAAVGWLTGRALTFSRGDRELGKGPELVFTMLLALGVLGLTRLVDPDGVLAVFTAGLAYNAVIPGTPREPQIAVDEGTNKYAVIPLFALLGIIAPWHAWRDLGWAAVLFIVGVIFVRRVLFVIPLSKALGVTYGQGTFMGWFGPMGVSAIFYMAHARDEGVTDPALFAAVTLAVTASVVVFGVTASPGRRFYTAHLAPAS